MKAFVSVIAGLMALGAYAPYAVDVLRGRAKPARSTRLMFVLLLFLTLLQQGAVQSGLLVMVTVGELIGSCVLLLMAIKHGEGGLSRLDTWCYLLLALELLLWASTKNALLALHLSVLADTIAFVPTLVKTWQKPWSETPAFYVIGAVAPALNILAANHYTYTVLLFPAYLVVANLAEVVLMVARAKSLAGSIPKTDSVYNELRS
ncbi:MAG TPA: hypothetical protein VLF69_04130 [Candidatus Saccharimonadales bacterium]|nr:hypothetical protein [Candidatus Saccharimonadales bacterium]